MHVLKKFLKKYGLELAAFGNLELFLWSAMRRYTETVPEGAWRTVLDALIMISGLTLIPLTWLLCQKWRRRTAERLRAFSRKLFRRLSAHVMWILERIQRARGREARDILTGHTRMEFDIGDGHYRRSRHRRLAWKQLESERDRLRWLYAAVIESKLKHGIGIRPSDTPTQISDREDSTPEESALFAMYREYRYDRRSEPPEGAAEEWKGKHFSGR